jgi:hypothetical protein
VAQFLDQWLKDKRPTIAASTYDGYEHLLRMHVKPDLGQIKLAKLTPQEVQALDDAVGRAALQASQARRTAWANAIRADDPLCARGPHGTA